MGAENIADAIWMISFLFQTGIAGSCEVACDGNGRRLAQYCRCRGDSGVRSSRVCRCLIHAYAARIQRQTPLTCGSFPPCP